MGEAATQLHLPGAEYRAPVRLTRCDELEQAAHDYLDANPRFWRVFCERAFELMARGHQRYSAKTICEVLRWHSDVGRGADYKINNSHVRVFADVFERTYPEHSGFFRKRERWSEARRARNG